MAAAYKAETDTLHFRKNGYLDLQRNQYVHPHHPLGKPKCTLIFRDDRDGATASNLLRQAKPTIRQSTPKPNQTLVLMDDWLVEEYLAEQSDVISVNVIARLREAGWEFIMGFEEKKGQNE